MEFNNFATFQPRYRQAQPALAAQPLADEFLPIRRPALAPTGGAVTAQRPDMTPGKEEGFLSMLSSALPGIAIGAIGGPVGMMIGAAMSAGSMSQVYNNRKEDERYRAMNLYEQNQADQAAITERMQADAAALQPSLSAQGFDENPNSATFGQYIAGQKPLTLDQAADNARADALQGRKPPVTAVQAAGLLKDNTPESVRVFQESGDPRDLVQNPAGPEKAFSGEKGLRSEFQGLTKDFRLQQQAVGRLLASAKEPSAAGDLALIFNYMKLLDPGSTVREGEFANAQNSGSVPTQITARYNQIVSGERLTGPQREDFIQSAGNIYNQAGQSYESQRQSYKDLAQKQGYDPENVGLQGVEFAPESFLLPTESESTQDASSYLERYGNPNFFIER